MSTGRSDMCKRNRDTLNCIFHGEVFVLGTDSLSSPDLRQAGRVETHLRRCELVANDNSRLCDGKMSNKRHMSMGNGCFIYRHKLTIFQTHLLHTARRRGNHVLLCEICQTISVRVGEYAG